MSAEGGAKKRAKFEAAPEPEYVPSHTVVVSSVGDIRPDEMVADAVTTFFLNQGRSVTNYMLLPEFGSISVGAVFLANNEYREKEKDPADRTKTVDRLVKKYVKKIIPSTAHLVYTECKVMLLLCHGAPRTAQFATPQPHFLSFYEGKSVTVHGGKSKPSEASRIWTCYSYTHTDEDGTTVEYQKPYGGVLLNDVVKNSKLVLLLACCGKPIMEEYGSQGVHAKPDFVVFSRPLGTCDISMNIFLAMLMTALEQCPRDLKEGDWDDVVRRNVCQVLLWIKQHGVKKDGEESEVEGINFWRFLQRQEIIMRGQQPNNCDYFRIKGLFNSQALTYDHEAKKDDKCVFLEELRSLTLMIWVGGGVGYDHINYTRSEHQLRAWMENKLPFTGYEHIDVGPGSVLHPLTVDAMLLQLRDVGSGA